MFRSDDFFQQPVRNPTDHIRIQNSSLTKTKCSVVVVAFTASASHFLSFWLHFSAPHHFLFFLFCPLVSWCLAQLSNYLLKAEQSCLLEQNKLLITEHCVFVLLQSLQKLKDNKLTLEMLSTLAASFISQSVFIVFCWSGWGCSVCGNMKLQYVSALQHRLILEVRYTVQRKSCHSTTNFRIQSYWIVNFWEHTHMGMSIFAPYTSCYLTLTQYCCLTPQSNITGSSPPNP